MKIVVALDSFKGSLTAVQACDIVAEAFRALVPEARVVTKPMADGGEGTASVLMATAGGQWVSRTVMGPLPEMQVEAGFVWLPGQRGGSGKAEGFADGSSDTSDHRQALLADATRTQSSIRNHTGAALVEMATASGLPLLEPQQRNPLKTTTYGTGQLIQEAIAYGARHILLAIGGSATVDGGVGAAKALGWRFLAQDGQEIGFGGDQLLRIARLVAPDWVAAAAEDGGGISDCGFRIADCKRPAELIRNPQSSIRNGRRATVDVLCDVDNPLTGEHGAARVYGPQKGATPEMVERLDAALAHLARVVKEQLGRDIADLPGAGAAGGLAAGAVAFLNARLVSGIEAVMAQTHLPEAMTGADWVITGEGCFDGQSLRGKVVSGVLRIARTTGTQVAVLAGQVRLEPGEYQPAGVEVALAAMDGGMKLEYAMTHGAALLDRAARRFVCEYLDRKEKHS